MFPTPGLCHFRPPIAPSGLLAGAKWIFRRVNIGRATEGGRVYGESTGELVAASGGCHLIKESVAWQSHRVDGELH